MTRLEQAKARDHRKLGKDLKLFHIDEAVGAGLTVDAEWCCHPPRATKLYLRGAAHGRLRSGLHTTHR